MTGFNGFMSSVIGYSVGFLLVVHNSFLVSEAEETVIKKYPGVASRTELSKQNISGSKFTGFRSLFA